MGGVIAVNKENVFKANGHSNDYWGWGNEDDDFNARLVNLHNHHFGIRQSDTS